VVLEQLSAEGKPASSTSREGPVPVLVCETSRELRAYSELFVEPVALRLGPAGEGGAVGVAEVEAGAGAGEQAAHPTYRSCQWEVFPEAWLDTQADGLDFLQGYIN
jgi:hypothetical protein